MRSVVTIMFFYLLALVPLKSLAVVMDAVKPLSIVADISGQWHIDKDDSDDLLRKFKSQVKKAQRKANRDGGGSAQRNSQRMPVFRTRLLMRTLPKFLRLYETVQIDQYEVKVIFDYKKKLSRQVFTDERPTTVSLLGAADGLDNVMVSGWEGGKLYIETTSALDVKIEEVYELVPGTAKKLKNTITIKHPLFLKPLTVVLYYHSLLDFSVTVAKEAVL